MESGYILFVGQEANFQSRSILIPYKEFVSVRSADYEILKKYSHKNVVFNLDDKYSDKYSDKYYTVDNLLVQNILPNGYIEKTEYTSICSSLIFYAEHSDFCDKEDKIWIEKSKFHLCKGFNHIKNHCILLHNILHKNKLNIIDSFLCLESINGTMEFPPVDSVVEMYDQYFTH